MMILRLVVAETSLTISPRSVKIAITGPSGVPCVGATICCIFSFELDCQEVSGCFKGGRSPSISWHIAEPLCRCELGYKHPISFDVLKPILCDASESFFSAALGYEYLVR